MVKSKNLLAAIKNNHGVAIVIVAICLAVLIGFVALAIDIGYMYVTRNELQNVADAAALAGCGELGKIYLKAGNVQAGHDVSGAEEDAIKKAATDVAFKNKAAGVDIVIKDTDIIIGQWDWDKDADPKYNPTKTNIEPDAVQVTARRAAGYEGGAVATFFARILNLFGGNHDTFEASAVATAALSGPSQVAPGILKAPFGISDTWFKLGEECPETVTFKSGTACAGWHNFLDSPPYKTNPYSSDMGEKMLNYIKGYPGGADWLLENFGDYKKIDQVQVESSPGTSVGESFYFTEGVSSLITNPDSTDYLIWESPTSPNVVGHSKLGFSPAPMAAIYDFFRFRDLPDVDNSKWATTVPVYHGCEPVNGYTPIVGYADIWIKKVNPPPESTIDVEIDCNFHVISGRGGGGQFGNLKGSIPNLVE